MTFRGRAGLYINAHERFMGEMNTCLLFPFFITLWLHYALSSTKDIQNVDGCVDLPIRVDFHTVSPFELFIKFHFQKHTHTPE